MNNGGKVLSIAEMPNGIFGATFLFDIEAAFNNLQQMTHKQFSSKGGKTMTPKRREALSKTIVKARAALARKRRDEK